MNRQENHGACAPKIKVCKGCEVEKLLGDFYPQKTGRFGRRSRCKSCLNRERLEVLANAPELTVEDVRKLFHYDGEQLWWRERPTKNFDMSKPAGKSEADGYRRIGVSGKLYLAHRLIWVHVHGVWPLHQIDHINHKRNDNRIENLRDTKENALNQSTPKNNSSGVVGVCWHKPSKKWQAQIRVNGKQIHLGGHLRKEDAIQARKEAERKYGFHPNHGS
jgi:hypothetical protein